MKKIGKLVTLLMVTPMFVSATTTVNIECDKNELKASEEANCKISLDTTDKISSLDFSLEKNDKFSFKDFSVNNSMWEGTAEDSRFLLYTEKEYTGKVELGTFKISTPVGIAKDSEESVKLNDKDDLYVYMSDDKTLSEVKVNEMKLNLQKSGDLSKLNDNQNNMVKNILIGVIVLAFVATGIIYFLKQKKN